MVEIVDDLLEFQTNVFLPSLSLIPNTNDLSMIITNISEVISTMRRQSHSPLVSLLRCQMYAIDDSTTSKRKQREREKKEFFYSKESTIELEIFCSRCESIVLRHLQEKGNKLDRFDNSINNRQL